MWQPGPPATDLALAGAELIVNISASPFHLLRDREREEMFRTRARDTAAFVALCNTVGGQDELIFDGHSFVIDDEGTVLARAKGFEEELMLVDIDPSSVVSRRLTDTRRRALAQDRGDVGPVDDDPRRRAARARRHARRRTLTPFCDDLEQMRLALELGLSDYVRKNGFDEIVVGVSGGIDSALVAALAAEALGAEQGALRLDAVALLVRRDARRRAAARREPRLRLPRDPDRADGRGVRRRARAELRGARARTSPRRTSRRGSAACC